MMRTLGRFVPLALLLVGWVGTASAMPITYDLIGPGGIVNSISFTVDGLTVVATAETSAGKPKVSPGPDGLGVKAGSLGDNTRQLDTTQAVEKLLLTFPVSVTLMNITFGRVDLDDEFSLALDGVGLISATSIPGGLANGKGVGTFDLTGFPLLSRTGFQLAFTAPTLTSDYRVKGLTVNTVPEPSALLLLGSGLAILVGLRRFRRQEEAQL